MYEKIIFLVLMCAVRCCAMENMSSCEKPLKKQKVMSEGDLRLFESRMTTPELSRNSNMVADYEISVPEIIVKIYAAIRRKNDVEAAQLHAFLQEKIYVDWQFLNEEQIEAYVNLDCNTFEKIHAIQPIEIKSLSPLEQEALYKPQATKWARQAVEANTDTSLDWRATFDSSKPNKPIPSPQSLRKHRLEQFDNDSKIQAQESKLFKDTIC